MPKTLIQMWSQLRSTAQQALCKAAEELVDDYTGTIILRCYKGGVRVVTLGQDFKPGDMEYRLGEEDGNAEDI